MHPSSAHRLPLVLNKDDAADADDDDDVSIISRDVIGNVVDRWTGIFGIIMVRLVLL